jgi:hypothetical protein
MSVQALSDRIAEVEEVTLRPGADPRLELQDSIEGYLKIIRDVLDRAKEERSEKRRDEFYELALQMMKNFKKLNQAKRVVLGLPPNG